MELSGRKLKKPVEGKIGSFVEMEIPTLKIKTTVMGRHVRVFSKVWIINHTDLTLQYREANGAAGIDAPFMRTGMAQVTHKSLGALGNTSADTERYNAHTVRIAYGMTPDEYDDSKIDWKNSLSKGSLKKSKFQTTSNAEAVSYIEEDDVTYSQDHTASSWKNEKGSNNSGFSLFGSSGKLPGLKKQRSGESGDEDFSPVGGGRITLDDALSALDPGQSFPAVQPMMRKRTMSVGGEDSASIVSDDSSFNLGQDHYISPESGQDFKGFGQSPPINLNALGNVFSNTSVNSREGLQDLKRKKSMLLKRMMWLPCL